METWKPIPDWEVYEVSDKGRVRRIKSGRILKQNLLGTYTKYHSVHLSKNNKQKRCLVHRLVLLAFVGPCPDGCECLHKDNNPLNNELSNLRWGTSKENSETVRLGGEVNGNSVLTEADVIEMRQSNETHGEVAARLGITASHVCQIRKGNCWRHVLTDQGLAIFDKDIMEIKAT